MSNSLLAFFSCNTCTFSILKDFPVENLETNPSTFFSEFHSEIYLSRIIYYWGSIFTLYLTWGAFSLVCVPSVFLFFLSFFCFISLSVFFFYQGFLHRNWQREGTEREGKGPSFISLYNFHRSRTLRNLFATLRVRWVSRIFNRNPCVYQTATWWDLPPYEITIWMIDWWCNVCLFTWWIDIRFLLHRFDIGNWSILTRIHCHPCITSEPTNQVC